MDAAQLLPTQLPAGWRMLTRCRDGAAYGRLDGMVVVSNFVLRSGGRRWVHISCSRDGKPLNLADLMQVKGIFLRPGLSAMHVLPPFDYGSALPACYHLWSPLDNIPLPDVFCGASD